MELGDAVLAHAYGEVGDSSLVSSTTISSTRPSVPLTNSVAISCVQDERV